MNPLENEIKALIISCLNLEDLKTDDIESDAPLFDEGLGLDSIDALELGVAIQKKYGISIKSQDENVKNHFYSVTTLSKFIKSQQGEKDND